MNNQLDTDLRFSIVPEWVLDADISDRAIRVYSILARYADNETLQAFPSRETLAQRCHCHWRSIDRAIDELVALGAVTKAHRKNGDSYQSNLYTLRRVLPRLSVGSDTGVTGVLTQQSVGTDTGGNLTITTELEPQELEPINDIEPKIAKASRMTKLPDDWYPSDRLLEMFATKWPNVDRDYEIEQFINYWHAEGKTKLDWDKAFQVWMARADKNSRGKVGGKRLTNSENAALLAMKYREQAPEIEEPVNYKQVKELGSATADWFKEID